MSSPTLPDGLEINIITDKLTKMENYTLRTLVVENDGLVTTINTKIYKDSTTSTTIVEGNNTYNVEVDRVKNTMMVDDVLHEDMFTYTKSSRTLSSYNDSWIYFDEYDSDCRIGAVLVGATAGMIIGELVSLFPWISSAIAKSWAAELISGTTTMLTLPTGFYVHTVQYYNKYDSNIRRGVHECFYDKEHQSPAYTTTTSWLEDFAD